MHITELNGACLLHLFSFLDKDSRKSLSKTCRRLQEVFLDPALWPLLNFHSPAELKRDNFLLGPSLRYLSICWHSSRVKVCNIEDWMKTTFQRDICSKHENTVNNFLVEVCSRCPNLLSLTLSGCGHVTDQYIMWVLQSCPRLSSLKLENCVRVTDRTLEAVTVSGRNLRTLHVDFCRNVTQEGLQLVRDRCPLVTLRAERSAGMIPDNKPEEKPHFGRTLAKLLQN
ncbi:F-box and leucine-rich protein 22 [Latimeria chalumnae]|uniref:F-box and leucine rich repeat protein 22 n=1 Tax=Latimeria chalumnae TaxID=7897 RepID=H3AP80_LATCH|nr:PREDICTED: F-box and leucine-rich protein 22 [Latimeria chalumnae]|eukprot:XP_005987777.1 PREDICTED: F-box and leucine-rich protein 22 [Latimeria chalumnae]